LIKQDDLAKVQECELIITEELELLKQINN